MREQIRNFDEMVGARRNLARLSDVFGKVAPKTHHSVSLAPSMMGFFNDINAARPRDVVDGPGTFIGAAAGGYIYRGSHPVLGVIGGASLGRNVPALFDDSTRKLGMRNLVTTGTAVLASKYMPKNPAIGFGLGYLAGALAAYFGGLK